MWTKIFIWTALVALLTVSGCGERRDMATLRRQAEQGDMNAQFRLGNCYRMGEGVLENKAEGIKWIRKAAEQGQVGAQFNLGMCYYKGDGLTEDIVEADKWMLLAGAAGEEQAGAVRKILVEKMNAAQVIAAKTKANTWHEDFERSHPVKQ